MQLNYNSQAADAGVYVIGSCGFDSIPADMGVIYTREQFKGRNRLCLGVHVDHIHLNVVCTDVCVSLKSVVYSLCF